jgi:NTE family protein
MIKKDRILGATAKTLLLFLVVTGVAIFVLTVAAYADEVNNSRPKIGLVLGGGGARGASYVGILKVLEKNRVPVDYIVGSSMGAVIGGAYAAGLSPEEIEKLLTKTDWTDLFTDKPIRENMTFRHKEEQRELMDFEFGLRKWKVLMPKGIIVGQKLNFLLESMGLPVVGIDNFDDLPIPFRAVTTDIETGDAVVLSKGSLPQSIRASMSIPGVFSPTEIDGHVLVDGGFTKTLPIDIAKNMGADIIIAVYVPEPLVKREKLNSIISVSSQLLNVMTQQMVKNQTALLGEKDILISPDLGNMSTTDLGNSKKAIELGEKSAENVSDKLKRYSISEEDYNKYLTRQRNRKIESAKVDFIKIEPPARVDPKVIKARVETKVGMVLNLKTLQDDLARIYGLGDFENVDFKINKEKDGTGLYINAKDKSWGPNYLRFGLNMDNDFQGGSYYNILADYTMTQLNPLGAEWKNQFQIGRTSMYHTDFYQPVDYANTFFIDPEFKVQRNISDIYNGSSRIAQYQVDSTEGGASVGHNIGTYMRGKFGVLTGHYNAKSIVGDPRLPAFDISQTSMTADIAYDTLDNLNFPHTGIEAGARLFFAPESWGAVNSYSKMDVSVLKPLTVDRHTLVASLSAGSNLGQEIPYYDEYTLGGFLCLSGYKIQQFRGQNMGLGRLVYYYKLADGIPPILSGVYFGGSAESGNVWQDVHQIDFGKMVYAGSFFIGLDTIVGPIYFVYGLAEKSDGGEFYIHIGKRF